MSDWKNFGEWARAVQAANAGGEPDPRLGPPLPEPAPLTDAELAQIEAVADSIDPDRPVVTPVDMAEFNRVIVVEPPRPEKK